MGNRTPAKFEVIADNLRSTIRSGDLKEGDKIPSESSLAQQYECSVGTARQAVQTLVHEGLLLRRRGARTTVHERHSEKIMGIIVGNTSNPDNAYLIDEFTNAAVRQGYSVLLCIVQCVVCGSEDSAEAPMHYNQMQDASAPRLRRSDAESFRTEVEFIERAKRLNVAGIVKAPVLLKKEPVIRRKLRDTRIPYVIVNDFWSDCRGENHVTVDERAAVEMAVEHLAGLGHREIAFYSIPSDKRPCAAKAFLHALENRGLPCDPERIYYAERADALGADARKGHITSVITPYYNYVERLSAGFKANELEVPEDMSVVELSGLPPLAHHPINATCTVTPMSQIADRALRILVEADTAGACHYVYQPGLHIGNTTAAPSGVMV